MSSAVAISLGLPWAKECPGPTCDSVGCVLGYWAVNEPTLKFVASFLELRVISFVFVQILKKWGTETELGMCNFLWLL